MAQIANRIMVLRHGKMVEEGTAEQVLEAPREDYTRMLVAERQGNLSGAVASHKVGDVLLEVSGVHADYG